jgi:hypothetical protein
LGGLGLIVNDETFFPGDLPEGVRAAAKVSIGNANAKKSPTASPTILAMVVSCKDANDFEFIVSPHFFPIGYLEVKHRIWENKRQFVKAVLYPTSALSCEESDLGRQLKDWLLP